MELVYLWIEDYKNIKEEGFNFSPRFTCNYDKDSNKLTIDENKDYVSIFPNNINVTAIVGENGSGKSSVLISIITNLKKQANGPDKYCLNKYCLIVSIDSIINIISTGVKVPEIYENNHIEVTESIQLKTENPINSFLRKFDMHLYDYHILSNNNSKNTNIYPIKKQSIDKIRIKSTLLVVYDVLIKNNKKKNFESYFSPDEIIIQSNLKYLPNVNNKKQVPHFDIRKFDISTSIKDNFSLFLFNIYNDLSNSLIRLPESDKLKDKLNLENISSLDNYEEILKKEIKKINKESEWQNEIAALKYKKEEDGQDILEYINNVFMKYLPNIKRDKNYLEKLLANTNENKKFSGTIKTRIKKDMVDEKYNYIFEELPTCFDLNFRDTKKKMEYLDLSSGEQSIIQIRCYIESVLKKQNNNKNFLFCFDEIEIELHPEWQRQLIDYLVSSFHKREQNIHFIFTSHSPVMLSDLPKENVIFLKKDENGNCKNVTKETKIQTFGANIHTLLSHGFFMENGLMGEFAKGKINEIIDFHKKVENNKENKKELDELKQDYENKKELFKHTQSIIGEDYLKQVIKNHIVEIEKLLYEDKYIDSEIERVKQELEKLEAVKNAKS